jgi:hypothetical protein
MYVIRQWDEEKFQKVFEQFGKITSIALRRDSEGKHKGFGFVNFEDHEEVSGKTMHINSLHPTSHITHYSSRRNDGV